MSVNPTRLEQSPPAPAASVIQGAAPQLIWKLSPGASVGWAINAAKQRLEDAGCDTAHLDAQVLLAHVLGVERTWLFAHYEYALTDAQADAFTALVGRRMQAEPIAYLIGRKEFYGLDFQVDRRALIPRPETELLVDALIDHIVMREERTVSVADVGTGSGAIALAVAANCPNARIYALDLSAEALAVAAENVRRLDANGQVTLLQGDLLAPLPTRVDMIVANLPYISSTTFPQLMADVRDYEPKLALVAGPEGLDAIDRLLRQAPHYLHTHGLIFLEIGADQGAAVLTLAKTLLPSAEVRLRQDYRGHDRVIIIAT